MHNTPREIRAAIRAAFFTRALCRTAPLYAILFTADTRPARPNHSPRLPPLDASNRSSIRMRIMRAPRIFVSLRPAQEIKATRLLPHRFRYRVRDQQHPRTELLRYRIEPRQIIRRAFTTHEPQIHP